MSNKITKSLIIPIYKNEENIPSLMEALQMIAAKYDKDFEVVFVVDGSPDESESIIKTHLEKVKFSSQIVSLSKNFGSYPAIRTGIAYARGKNIAVMAADLQEPPELVNQFFEALENDSADVVFGQRLERQDSIIRNFFSNFFWFLYRMVVMKDVPKGGVDIFACNEKVKISLLSLKEVNTSLIAQLFWLGYRRLFMPYKRKKRLHGKSSWSIGKRFRYMIDSIFSFSDLPIILILWIGFFGLLFSFVIGIITIIGKLTGTITAPGYTTMTLIIVFFSSAIILTQGIIGCYLWRAFENTKHRPTSVVKNHKIYK